jgi:NAD(P)-dependent dehydrogenase (short-subunit alcohol dehydrogenase family)
VKSSFFLAKEAIPHMEKRGKASVIFVSSLMGYIPNYAVSSISVAFERKIKLNCPFSYCLEGCSGSVSLEQNGSSRIDQVDGPGIGP